MFSTTTRKSRRNATGGPHVIGCVCAVVVGVAALGCHTISAPPAKPPERGAAEAARQAGIEAQEDAVLAAAEAELPKDITGDEKISLPPGDGGSTSRARPSEGTKDTDEPNVVAELTVLLDGEGGKEIATAEVRIHFGQYHALIIGNNEYRHLPKLKTAVHDARTVAKTLGSDYGFEVKLIENATRAEILEALGHYRTVFRKSDNLLIYYAGHGWLDKDADLGYWLPVDATRDSEVNWVPNASITGAVRAMLAKHVMIVADSCYSGKLVRGMGGIGRRRPDYVEQMAKKKARIALASGGLEPVVDSGGAGDHSVFASAFLRALRENKHVMDGTQLFTKIREPVVRESDQTPEFAPLRKAGHDGGDFLFVRRRQK